MQVFGGHAGGEGRSHKCPGTGAGDHVGNDVVFVQDLEHTDVSYPSQCTTTQGKSAHTRMGNNTRRYGQTVKLCLIIYISKQSTPVYSGGFILSIHSNPPHE